MRLPGRLGAAAVGIAAMAAYVSAVRPWMLGWGATDEETRCTLPGDELVPDPKLNSTHGITIRASAGQVWPWLVQIGQGKGGFYSYDWIENLMGLDIHNADRILPQFQNLRAGDRVSLASGVPGIPVAILK